MVTFLELKNAKFDSMREAVAKWDGFASRLLESENAFRGGVNDRTERAGWRGVSAGVADLELEQVTRRIALASMEAKAIANALKSAPDAFTAAQKALFDIIDEAASHQLNVVPTDTGFDITDGQETPSTDQAAVNARYDLVNSYVTRLNAVLQQANDADARHAAVLATLMPGDVAQTNQDAWKNAQEDMQRAALLNGAGPFPANLGPEQAKTWWTSLSAVQQQEYIQAYSQQVGSTDGLPAGARDQANRIALDQRLAELGVLAAGPNLNAKYDAEIKNLTKIKQTLDAGANRPPEQRLMLLKFGNQYMDGQVVMAVGNPDTAKNTVVHVPGVNTNVLDKLDDNIDRMSKLQAASDALTPGVPGDSAAIFWMDYDPPEFDWKQSEYTGMLQRDRAQEGAPKLDGFVNGLKAQSPDHHLTVSGHSYGSTVIGEAAQAGDGLAVTDIVVEGSPGMDVDSAKDLRIDPGHVWAMRADGDNLVPGGGQLFHGHNEGAHGLNLPSDHAFGGNVMVANSGDHGSYWNTNEQGLPDDSLENTARVVMGTYNDPNPANRPAVEEKIDIKYADAGTGTTSAPSA